MMMTDPGEFVQKSMDKYEPESETADAADAADAKARKRKKRRSKMVDQWGKDSFPASDPPGHY